MVTLLILALSVFISCEVPFDPKGAFEQIPIVYSVLNPDRDTQYVRIHLSYDPPSFDPFEITADTKIDSAQVLVADDTDSIPFSMTAIPRNDTTRYTTPINAYVSTGPRPRRGATYRLSVARVGWDLEAFTRTPPPLTIESNSGYVLDNPGSTRDDIFVRARYGTECYGLLLRMVVEYEDFEGGQWKSHKQEVPTAVASYTNCLAFVPIFPAPERTSSDGQPRVLHVANLIYRRTLVHIIERHKPSSVTFRRAVMLAFQFDEHLYKYYNLVNGFKDEFSIRTDEPDYTNIKGGRGVFGAMTVDSLIHVFPVGDPIPNLGCFD